MTTPYERWLPNLTERLNAVLTEEQTEAALTVLKPQLVAWADYENAINWHTDCTSCARILESSYAETMRAENAEKELADFEESVVGDMNERAIDNAREIARLKEELTVMENRMIGYREALRNCRAFNREPREEKS